MQILLAISDRFFGDALVNFTAAHHWPDEAHYKLIKVVLPVEKQPGATAEDRAIFFQEDMNQAQELLDKLSRMLHYQKKESKISTAVLVGQPAKTIVEHATNWPADMIILGAREQSNFEQFFLGSVSKYIAEHSPCSFCIVRIPNDETLDLNLSEKELLEELEIPVG